MIAIDLATEPQAGCREKIAKLKHGFFGFSHFLGLAFDELHAARCAPRLAAAGMELIDLRFILERKHESFAGRDVEAAGAFNGQFGHECLLWVVTDGL